MTLANWITLVRAALAPVILVTLLGPYPGYAGVVLLLLAGATDLLDGALARRRNEVSELGKVLDPVADKLVIGAVLLALVVRRGLPAFLAWTFAVKEGFQLLGGAVLLRRSRRVIPSNVWGKLSSTVYYLGFFAYYLLPAAGVCLIGLGVLLSIAALATYFAASFTE